MAGGVTVISTLRSFASFKERSKLPAYSPDIGGTFKTWPDKTQVFPSVGRCIYCKNPDDLPLSKEHIIPESIGGMTILPHASCQQCAKITSQFERFVAQKSFDFLRKKFGIRQKPKKRNNQPHVQVTFEKDGRRFTKRLAVCDIPANFSTINLPTPQWYIDMYPSPSPGFVKPSAITASFEPDVEQFLSLHNADRYFLPNEFNPEVLARVLAKIAHSYAIAQYGFDDVDSDLSLIILGQESPFPLVGSAPFLLSEAPHMRIHTVTGMTMPFNGENVIVVFIRLFARVSNSHFVVRVGRDRSSMDAPGWKQHSDPEFLISRMTAV